MNIIIETNPTHLVCTKCKKDVPAINGIKRNPKQWKKYSRNNDSHVSACCGARLISVYSKRD